MEILKNRDLISVIRKNKIMAISCYYGSYGELVSKLFCYNSNEVHIDVKPSKIINLLCELYNQDTYYNCAKRVKKIILCNKKIPVFLNDEYGSIWIPLSSTSQDTNTSFWINMNFLSVNPHCVFKDKKTNELNFIFNDGQKIKYSINQKLFMIKWGEGAALSYEVRKMHRRMILSEYRLEENEINKNNRNLLYY